ncbi:hypothetical protein [Chromohalobacter israelensis]|uniref:hypothetical protein n=1 Tax=Chromohalobacter israelensis TaxID=141390 RepID=UPI0011B225D0|nr:hypothetical protein [Chromohalobacter salexigens]
MQNDPRIFLLMAASFVVTILLFVFIVRRSKPGRRLIWIIVCSIATLAWLGVVKGVVVVMISIVLSTGYVSNRLDGRRMGKKIALSFNIQPNLFFSSLEKVLPMYLHVLATMDREGVGIEDAKEISAPLIIQGLDVLESRFGQQALTDDARKKLDEYVSKNETESV